MVFLLLVYRMVLAQLLWQQDHAYLSLVVDHRLAFPQALHRYSMHLAYANTGSSNSLHQQLISLVPRGPEQFFIALLCQLSLFYGKDSLLHL